MERHPLLPQWDLLEYCAAKGIVLQAHTPLGGGDAALLQHAVVRRVADESGLSPAQVLLQWNLRHGAAVATKATGEAHCAEALGACAAPLGAAHMKWLDGITPAGEPGRRFLCPPFMRGTGAYAW